MEKGRENLWLPPKFLFLLPSPPFFSSRGNLREGGVYIVVEYRDPLEKCGEEEEEERERKEQRSELCTNNDGNNVDLVGRQTHPCNIPIRFPSLPSSFLPAFLPPPRLYPRGTARWNPMGSIIRRIL